MLFRSRTRSAHFRFFFGETLLCCLDDARCEGRTQRLSLRHSPLRPVDCGAWFCPHPALVPCLCPCICPCSCSCFCSCLLLHLLLLPSQLLSFLAVQEATGTEQTASGLRVVAFLMCWTERSVWPAASTSATCSCTCRVHTVCLHAPLVSWDEETF